MFLLIFYGFCHATAATEPVIKDSDTQIRWDDWPCKNLKTDWNYLFHPHRINQYLPPPDTIDQNEGENQSWLNTIEKK